MRRFRVFQPDDGPMSPPHPLSNTPDVLRRFTDEEFITIAMFRLAGLADTGLRRAFVPRPDDASTDDVVVRAARCLRWNTRFPIRGPETTPEVLSPDPRVLPPELAEEMLAFVKKRLDKVEKSSDTVSHEARVSVRGMSVAVAKQKAEALVKAQGFPQHRGKASTKKLAQQVGCSPATMKKAIEESLVLQRERARLSTDSAAELERLKAEQALDARSSHGTGRERSLPRSLESDEDNGQHGGHLDDEANDPEYYS